MRVNHVWKIIAALVLVFVAGSCAGGFFIAWRIQRSFEKSLQFDRWADSTEESLSQKLSLTPDQRIQTRAIIKDMEREFRSIFGRTFDESGRLLVESGRRLDHILTPEQQVIHARMKEDLRRTLKRDLKMELPQEPGLPSSPPQSHRILDH